MSYIPNVRAIKGLAPTASQFNQLANNLEWLNTNRIPKYATLNLSGDKSKTTSSATAYVDLDFDQVLSDPNSYFSGGQLLAPSDSKFLRITFQLGFDSTADRNFLAVSQLQGFVGNTNVLFNQLAFNIGHGATGDGILVANYDTGWVSYDASFTQLQRISIGGPTLTNFVIKSANQTWLCLEVIT